MVGLTCPAAYMWVLLLASDAGSYIIGTVLVVGGGLLCGTF